MARQRSPSPDPPTKVRAKVRAKARIKTSAKVTVKATASGQMPRGPWTDEEEQIWREVVVAVLRAPLLPTLRADGRLAHRCIGSHLSA
ncbi:hypothetical protein CspeluHIS016_0209910 [Cutaneotrichosporon spelunceum]|uniref:Uncharacterized protein n=1 Tax=Cutaneotrichosporon spelunceum TaxID=1672016 RepID=A0AAD3TSB7_9TREE|nr:hypothetical protein CspeluHIS016_0209910 [Cutaneotrichosporon spelunceum]